MSPCPPVPLACRTRPRPAKPAVSASRPSRPASWSPHTAQHSTALHIYTARPALDLNTTHARTLARLLAARLPPSPACLLLAFHPRPPACCSPSTLARLLAARLPPSPTRLLPCHAMPRPIAPAVDHAGRATPRPPSCTVTTFAARWSAVADAFFQFILNTPRDHAHHARQGVQA
ncbi:hypothetical protein PMIN01_11614 [Paraphaeosphaeria minitans]|uniref:Uncharacterized protein n=1 Tax=Paraphaeosphaeria minitans TaxID=565426 RepID=A0A9P6GAC8_9PLEO|nr:hypothetical protein PMIN01_11614 [Paraphaeosphaeria minitans]